MANRNQNFDFPPASDSNLQIGSLTDRFQDLRQQLNLDQGESSNSQREQRPHRSTPSQIHSTRYRNGRRSTHHNTHNDVPPVAVLRRSRSPSSSPAAYTPPTVRPGRARHSSWRRHFRREMQDGTETLEGLIRDRPARLNQLHWQLNGVCYRVGNVCHR